jgi:uncharacterized OsmC-like protein
MLKILPEKADIVKDQIKIRLSSTGDDNEYFGAERVDVTYTEHLMFTVKKAKHSFLVDEAEDRGGTDRAPNPLAYFLAGAASCLGMQYIKLAILKNVNLTSLAITVRGHYSRKMGGAFSEIIYVVRVESEENNSIIAELAEEAEKLCFVHQTLKNAVKLITNVYLNGHRIK